MSMTELEQISARNIEQYGAFTRECRQIIGEEVRIGCYPNLCSNTKRHGGIYIPTLRARVNIIGRPQNMEHSELNCIAEQ